jgi:hypothetical protein
MAMAPKAAPEPRHMRVPEERTARILADRKHHDRFGFVIRTR